MHLAHTQPNYFTPHHAELALALANQAAVAVENARLYKEAQRAAALDERQRLARDLHDSLSQALFGIALSANAAQETWVQGGDIGSSLDVILRLADSALENLRALILELRPEVLEREGLTAALTKQVQETCARHQLQATCELGEELDLPLETKEALYWIAQEALNNVIRHAKAKHVAVRLHQTADAVVLEVYDDGVGFSPSTPVPGHLGRQSMQERAARLGGTLDITSRPGEGTCVQATIGLMPVESPQHLRK
jgi:signal transduction histidine kinase